LKADQSETINRHTVDQAIVDRLKDEAFELDKLYVALSREEIEKIVSASEQGGEKAEAEAVSEVFSKYDTQRPQSGSSKPAVSEAQSVPQAIQQTQVALTKETASVPDLSMSEEAP